MKLWRWQLGRQGTSYEKMLLLGAKWPIQFDGYVLRYKTGVHIPAHIDTVEFGQHIRLNLLLKRAKQGGDFYCEKLIWDLPRLKLFRPDLYKHSVSKVISGNRYILSIGWIKNQKSS